MRYSFLLILLLLLLVLPLLNGCTKDYKVNRLSFTKEAEVTDTCFITNILDAKKDSLLHLRIAQCFIGTREATNNNDGKEVEMFLHGVGRHKGDAWCAAFVSYCLEEANVKYPKVRSGLARHFKTEAAKKISARDVLLGRKDVPPGSLVIWEKGTTIFGHVGIVEKWNRTKGTTVEGNTNSGYKNSIDGVYERYRSIQPANHFRITTFTEVGY